MAKRRGRKKKINVETLLKLRKRGIKEGEKYGKLLGSPEDVGQEYVCRLLEGKHRKSTVQQAVIDMAREQGGRHGQPGHEAKKSLAYAQSVGNPLEERGPEDRQTKLHRAFEIKTSHDPRESIENTLDLQHALEFIKHPKQRLVMERYLEGMTYQEIADSEEFKCTQAYIHHLFKKAVMTIRKRLGVSI